MRFGEKSLIMIKPKWGFAYKKQTPIWPPGFDTDEKREVLLKRRIFYEVKLHDWTIRHDLNSDGMILKTFVEKGIGYDRPFHYDELCLDLKTY